MLALTELDGMYHLDPAHSSIAFVARHAGIAKVRGTFDEYEGSATIDGENPAASTLEVHIKTASVNTRNAEVARPNTAFARTRTALFRKLFPLLKK